MNDVCSSEECLGPTALDETLSGAAGLKDKTGRGAAADPRLFDTCADTRRFQPPRAEIISRPRPWKNAPCEVAPRCVFLSWGRACPLIDCARLERGDQVLIAAISGPTPKIVIIRLRL